ncbi:MAG: GNAT family N-acetyltransferase [Pseudomonadota bacterium]
MKPSEPPKHPLLAPRQFRIRAGLRPGDFGSVVEMHGRVYAAEYDLDTTFELYVAEPLIAFVHDLRQRGDAAGAIWIAEARDSDCDVWRMAGSLALVDGDETQDIIRWVVLSPDVRGRGLAQRLMATAIHVFLARGKSKLTLGTFSKLDAAIALYKRYGFVETSRNAQRIWGQDLELVEMELPRDRALAV